MYQNKRKATLWQDELVTSNNEGKSYRPFETSVIKQHKKCCLGVGGEKKKKEKKRFFFVSHPSSVTKTKNELFISVGVSSHGLKTRCHIIVNCTWDWHELLRPIIESDKSLYIKIGFHKLEFPSITPL